MSNISTIYDAIVTRISSNLSSYKQIANPYELEGNNQLYLNKGFSVAIGAGIATERLIGCQTSWERTFIISLVQRVTTTEHNVTAKETITKAILEDHFTLLSAFETESSLSGSASSAVFKSDTGFELVELDGKRYFVCEMELVVEYFEDLTS